MSPVIHLNDVSFTYDQTEILKDVNLDVTSGEFIGIIGPNGGGKTTLLNLLMGFLKPKKGVISIFGTSPKNARKKIAWVPQGLGYDRSFPISVLEVVLGGRLSNSPWFGGFPKKDREKAQQKLKQVGLLSFQDAPFASLSGGQTQRVLIARALASEPALLFLDEPVASVDPNAESEIYRILSELKGSLTIVMVTHDLRAILEQVDRVVCVQKEVTILNPQAICEHFAFGVYHPLIQPQNLPFKRSQ
jgi:zinc transport system ATP-binding protein